MEVVVDVSAFFAAVIGRGKTMKLFFEDELKLVAPSYFLAEFEDNRGYLAGECGLPVEEFSELVGSLLDAVEVFPASILTGKERDKAKELAPHPKDEPYFALALHLGCDLWTRESDWADQGEIDVYFTEDLVEKFLEPSE